MAIDLGAIEKALLDRLAPIRQENNISVGALDAQELNRPVTTGQVFVAYLSDTPIFGLLEDYPQVLILEWAILIQYQNLQTHAQVYPLLAKIRKLLHGFEPAVGHVLSPFRCGKGQFVFDAELINNGIWRYQILGSIEIQNCEE